MRLLIAILACLPVSLAHASNGTRPAAAAEQDGAPATERTGQADRLQDGTDRPKPARRTRMVEATSVDRPVMKSSATYRLVGRDPAGLGNCLKATGTRLKRDKSGAGACTIGAGRAYVPDR